MAAVRFLSPSLRCEWLRTSRWNAGSHSEPLQAGGQSGPGIIKRSARHPLQVPGSPNGTMSFKVEEMEVKIGRVTRNENEPVRQPPGALPGEREGGGRWVLGGAESSVGAFLCDYMFNLLHISKKKRKKRKNVRYDRANLQWSRCECQANEKKAAMKPFPAASNGISMNLRGRRVRESRQPCH